MCCGEGEINENSVARDNETGGEWLRSYELSTLHLECIGHIRIQLLLNQYPIFSV